MLAMLKSKIHRATVTGSEINYSGSLRIDARLMKAAALLPNEMVHVWDVTNGSRFRTYVVSGKTGEVVAMGAASRLCKKGDVVIIAAETLLNEKDAKRHKPRIVFVNGENAQVKGGKKP